MTSFPILSNKEKKELIQLANKAADRAREAILPYFRKNIDVSNKDKEAFDPVTEADKAGEDAIRKVISFYRPDDGIWGEENGESESNSGYRWVIDPIDGTRSFISGTPTWGVLISLEQIGNGPILGIIDQPYIKERFIGGFGTSEVQGPLGVRSLQVSATSSLSESKLFTTFPEVGTEKEKMGFSAVAREAKLVRYGLDCYAYALVAAGQVDLVIEASLNAYDIQAPISVIQAAGGVVTSWSGEPAHLGGQVIAAANQKLHQQALDILNPYSDDK